MLFCDLKSALWSVLKALQRHGFIHLFFELIVKWQIVAHGPTQKFSFYDKTQQTPLGPTLRMIELKTS